MSRQRGLVVAAYGRHYTVEFDDGSTRQCFPRGKKGQAAVGDHVVVSLHGSAEGAIEAIEPRRNLLYRSDQTRSKQFAANVDRILLVIATEPAYSDDLLGRSLAAAWSAEIAPLVILNKIDRLDKLPATRASLEPIRALGVPIIEVSALDTAATRAALTPWLAGCTSLLLGQSGMGKSTLLNALVPGADAATREHSEALGAGRHTTTSTRLYHLPGEPGAAAGHLIDSPGFQGFGLQHLSREDVERGFPEFAQYAAHCRFYNCTHRHEPGCAVLAALAEGAIGIERHALYKRILEENEAGERY